MQWKIAVLLKWARILNDRMARKENIILEKNAGDENGHFQTDIMKTQKTVRNAIRQTPEKLRIKSEFAYGAVLAGHIKRHTRSGGDYYDGAQWIEHIEADGGNRRDVNGWRGIVFVHQAQGCKLCAERARTRRANKRARDRHEAYTACGLVRVRGALGGVYYE